MAKNVKTGHRQMAREAWYDRAVRLCLYALAAAVPMVFTPMFHTVFSMPKLVVLRSLTAAIIALWGCKVFVEGKLSWRLSKLNVLLLAYGAVSLITAFRTIAQFTSVYGAEGRFIGIITVINFLLLPFFVYNFLKEEKTIKNFIGVSLGVSGILALYGLLQYFGVFSEIMKWNADPSERVFGTIGHGNHFGAYLGMNILLGTFLFAYVKELKWRLALISGLALMAITLILTASRGALFATVLVLIDGAVVVALKNWPQVKSFLKRLPVIISLVIMAALLAGSVITGQLQNLPIVERTVGTIEFVRQGNVPDRLSWWMSSVEMIMDRPLLGYGLGTYRDIYNAYRRLDYVSPGPGDMQDLITPEYAHNEFLNIAATQGLVGLAAFLAMVIYVLYRLDRLTLLTKKPGHYFYFALGIKGALLVYLVQVIVSFGEITTLTMFYLMLGLGVALATAAEAKTDPQAGKSSLNAPDLGVKSFRLNRAAKYAASYGMIIVCCLAGYVTYKEASAEYYLKQAEVRAAVGDVRGAIENYRRATLAKPFEYAYYSAFGDFALKNADLPALNADSQMKMLVLADANYQSAVAINPHHPSVFYNMAVGELQLFKMTGQKSYFDRGVENLKQAVGLAVNNPLYPYQAAKALLGTNIEGINLAAAQYFKQALQIRPGYRDAEALMEQVRLQ